MHGLAVDKLGEKSLTYFEYSDLSSIVRKYQSFLNENEISTNRAVILVRQQNLKNELETNSKESKHPILDALQLWIQNTPASRLISLELAAKEIHKWFGGAKSRKNYYCPEANSVYRWRIFIKDFFGMLNSLS